MARIVILPLLFGGPGGSQRGFTEKKKEALLLQPCSLCYRSVTYKKNTSKRRKNAFDQPTVRTRPPPHTGLRPVGPQPESTNHPEPPNPPAGPVRPPWPARVNNRSQPRQSMPQTRQPAVCGRRGPPGGLVRVSSGWGPWEGLLGPVCRAGGVRGVPSTPQRGVELRIAQRDCYAGSRMPQAGFGGTPLRRHPMAGWRASQFNYLMR